MHPPEQGFYAVSGPERQGDLQPPDLEGHGGAAAHTGPGRKGPDAWPPRDKVGAEERSPSAPLLGPSIVNERGGEAPRVQAGEPLSPVPLPSGGDFAAFIELFEPRSPLHFLIPGNLARDALTRAGAVEPLRWGSSG